MEQLLLGGGSVLDPLLDALCVAVPADGVGGRAALAKCHHRADSTADAEVELGVPELVDAGTGQAGLKLGVERGRECGLGGQVQED